MVQDEDVYSLISAEIAGQLFKYETYGSELGLTLLDVALQP